MKALSQNQWLTLVVAICLGLMVFFNLATRPNVAAQEADETIEAPRLDPETAARQAHMAQKEADMQASYRDPPGSEYPLYLPVI